MGQFISEAAPSHFQNGDKTNRKAISSSFSPQALNFHSFVQWHF